MQPDRVHLADGSAEENQMVLNAMVHSGMMIKLNEAKRPNSYLARSGPDDVARVESRTYICSKNKEDAGPTNNWEDPLEMRRKLDGLMDGAMRGRTMYVLPYSMGPLGSPISKLGVQITDSPYVLTNMRIMTRMGQGALDVLGRDGAFIPCLHTVGVPLADGKREDSPWPCNKDKYITHFPDDPVPHIMSYGSGYGGNALLGKKCYALRIASTLGRKEGWLAEHMLILKLTSPEGIVKYMAACFPSACGKTATSMMAADLPGWRVETVGDDIAWMRWGPDGRLRAINPEAGFFGVAPGTNARATPNAMAALEKNCIFTNVAMTPDGDVWWEDMTKEPPKVATNWLRREWRPSMKMDAAHPNSRFTAPAAQCPIIAKEWEDPAGVPIDAILMGGRRSTVVPLVTQSLDWKHGVYMGATMMSEITNAAVEGNRGELRFDPFAMKPFCGYNMADYWGHWLNIGKNAPKGGAHLPKIFFVNWFRRSEEGKFLWPGFGSNSRVLAWIFRRCEGDGSSVPTVETPIGFLPDAAKGGIDTTGLSVPQANMQALLSWDRKAWRDELALHVPHLQQFGARLPAGITEQHERIKMRLA